MFGLFCRFDSKALPVVVIGFDWIDFMGFDVALQVVLNQIQRMLFGKVHAAVDFFVFYQRVEFVSGLGILDIYCQVASHINGVS